MIDQSTYGFSKQDANSLLENIELKDEVTQRKGISSRRISAGAAARLIKLRISGLDFQISYDAGTTWSTWATGGECV